MSTEREYSELIVMLLQPEPVRVHPMFGEYCLYHNEKPIAFLCDNRVLLKPTNPPIDAVESLETGEAYPGSNLYYIAPEDRLDTPWFRETIVEMSRLLPKPKPRKKR